MQRAAAARRADAGVAPAYGDHVGGGGQLASVRRPRSGAGCRGRRPRAVCSASASSGRAASASPRAGRSRASASRRGHAPRSKPISRRSRSDSANPFAAASSSPSASSAIGPRCRTTYDSVSRSPAAVGQLGRPLEQRPRGLLVVAGPPGGRSRPRTVPRPRRGRPRPRRTARRPARTEPASRGRSWPSARNLACMIRPLASASPASTRSSSASARVQLRGVVVEERVLVAPPGPVLPVIRARTSAGQAAEHPGDLDVVGVVAGLDDLAVPDPHHEHVGDGERLPGAGSRAAVLELADDHLRVGGLVHGDRGRRRTAPRRGSRRPRRKCRRSSSRLVSAGAPAAGPCGCTTCVRSAYRPGSSSQRFSQTPCTSRSNTSAGERVPAG